MQCKTQVDIVVLVLWVHPFVLNIVDKEAYVFWDEAGLDWGQVNACDDGFWELFGHCRFDISKEVLTVCLAANYLHWMGQIPVPVPKSRTCPPSSNASSTGAKKDCPSQSIIAMLCLTSSRPCSVSSLGYAYFPAW